MQPDQAVTRPQTRAANRVCQTQSCGDRPSQFDEKGDDESDDGSSQMTASGMESSSEDGHQDIGDAQSSIILSTSQAPDPTHQWGIKGIKVIFADGLYQRGKTR